SNANALDQMFGDAQTGLSASLQRFVDSFHDVASSPSSIPARQVVLSQARSFSERLHAYDARLTQIDSGLDAQIASEAAVITNLARGIAALNQRIEVEQARTGQPPNDLLDQRDTLIDELSTHVNISVTKQDGGAMLIAVGNGQSLVVGSIAAVLTPLQDAYDPLQRGIGIQGLGVSVDITSRLAGGKLGGLLDFRREMLTPARNSLGRLSIAVSDVVNQQHRAGIDLSGNFGGNLLAVGNVEVLAENINAGSATLAVTRTNIGALTDYDYMLESNAGVWTLRRADTGATVTMTGAGTVGSPFVAAGLSLVVGGAAASGDSFLIRPTRAAVAGLNVLVTDPDSLALAAPIIAAVNTTNIGNGQISSGEVLNVANPQLQTPATIQFLSASTYSINGGAAQAYTSGANIDANGWRVQISGAPNVGDQFTVGPMTNPAGDNRNALKLTEALARPVLNNGTVSLHANVGRIVGDVGVATSLARTQRDAQEALHGYNVDAGDAISGVNLDEEAANLLRFQQAYQAAAQAISIADRLFQSVLDATRR
ncbi:MAG: flagellar hook-associated protein FlgK, partial [Candidatus Obscuribacterales bacterium]|nr:flagellar hook-associated protein FlgK [Steroidobacteraceae bacterium]